MKRKPTTQWLLSTAINSVRQTGGLSLFWATLQRQRASLDLTVVEAKEFAAARSAEIFRKASGANLAYYTGVYDIASFRSGEMAVDPLDEVKYVSLVPLMQEIPDYLDVIKPKPLKVRLVEYILAVRDVTVLQPLFKVVCQFAFGGRQLYIVGRDRYTKEPFALGVPNGFVKFPIDVALRWTMNVHKGDIVKEV